MQMHDDDEEGGWMEAFVSVCLIRENINLLAKRERELIVGIEWAVKCNF